MTPNFLQKEITVTHDLLNDKGHLENEGYARKALLRYDRNRVKASKLRVKEWDYYYVVCPEYGYGITFTISDLGYLGLTAICWLDFNKKKYSQIDSVSLFPLGKTGLTPAPGDGNVSVHDKKISLSFDVKNNKRVLEFNCPDFQGINGESGLSGEIILHQDPEMDSMVIASSWEENRKAFYYNQKTNCMPAEGTVKIGSEQYQFHSANSFAGLDWGRGNWTYRNRWYWGSASGLVNGEPFGFNIGYGFSDRKSASENMMFHKGVAHKLSDVEFSIDTENYLAPWTFTSSDGRFELEFEPVMDRKSSTDLVIFKSVQHQVFGHFTGEVILDDGEKLHLDRFFGFAEDVLNWW